MQIGCEFAKSLPSRALVFLHGDLGAGKTTFVKGMADAFQVTPESVSSPTFQYLNIYKCEKTIYHFDLYRLTDEASFVDMGFDEFLEQEGISCIEWAERLESLRKVPHIDVTLSHEQEGRRIHICPN